MNGGGPDVFILLVYKVFHIAADIRNRHGCSGKNGFLAAFMLFSYFFHTYPFENVDF